MAGNTEKVIDFSDSLSSISLLKVTQVFGKMGPSEILEIRGTDPDIRQDLFKVLPHQDYEVISTENCDGESTLYRIRIRKCR